MKRNIIYLLTLLFAFSCSGSDEELPEQKEESVSVIDTLSIRPYSYDFTMSGMTLVYHVRGASEVEALYKEQSATVWNKADIEQNKGVVIVNLKELRLRAYYHILIIARNEIGESVTDTQTILFDYEAVRGTYYMQPYLIWGTPLVNTKKALTDAGNILDAESVIDGEYHLEYRFKYKELKNEYIFDTEQKLKEVIIYFDVERATVDELRRFVSYALGYLAYGNIHVIMKEKEYTFPLYRTSEGSSYVFIYSIDDKTIVDYICSSSVDLSEKLNK